MSDYIKLKHVAQLAAECTQMNYLLDAGITSAFRLHATPEAICELVAENERINGELQRMTESRNGVVCMKLDAQQERDQLKAENEALRKDAERYRWLRNGAGYCDTRDIPGMAPARMDEFIDAAIINGEQK